MIQPPDTARDLEIIYFLYSLTDNRVKKKKSL